MVALDSLLQWGADRWEEYGCSPSSSWIGGLYGDRKRELWASDLGLSLLVGCFLAWCDLHLPGVGVAGISS